jgi:hypothetical protein
VSHVLRKQFAVAQEVEVIPAVDFGKVEEVFVLLDGAGSAAGGEGGAAPAPPPEPEGEDSRATDGGPP